MRKTVEKWAKELGWKVKKFPKYWELSQDCNFTRCADAKSFKTLKEAHAFLRKLKGVEKKKKTKKTDNKKVILQCNTNEPSLSSFTLTLEEKKTKSLFNKLKTTCLKISQKLGLSKTE